MNPLVDDWMSERNKHPFFGEKLSKQKIADIWDRTACTYDAVGMGSIPDEITSFLADSGWLCETTSVMDIGSGPGIYGLRFAERCKHVICLDGSQVMLDRLTANAERCGRRNVTVVREDWNDHVSDSRYDLVFSSLCPPLNCPEGLLKMESLSNGVCAYVSSMNNDKGSIHMDIWKALGRDYTFNGYNTHYPYDFLAGCGRSPSLKTFHTESASSVAAEKVIEQECSRFSVYMDIDEAVSGVIKCVVEERSEDGMIYFDGKKSVGLLTWSSPN